MFKIGDVLVPNNDCSKHEEQIIGIYEDEYWVLQLHSKTKYMGPCNYMHNHYKLKSKELEVGKWYLIGANKIKYKIISKFKSLQNENYIVYQYINSTCPTTGLEKFVTNFVECP